MERLIDANRLKAELVNIKENLEEAGEPQAVGMAAVFAYMMEIVDMQPEIDPPNAPLTLEQLREMDWEPVRISPYGKTWFVYRRKEDA